MYLKLFIPQTLSESTATIASTSLFQTESCDVRQRTGSICMTCEILATCVNRTSGWAAVPLEICDTAKGLFCNPTEGRCSTATGPCNPIGQSGRFVCTSEGIFPDPYNCQMYHMCAQRAESTMVAANAVCGDNSAFDPATSGCNLNTASEVCTVPQFTCDNVGEMGAWPANPSIYYICMANTIDGVRFVFPNLYRCDKGQVFNGRECVTGSGNVGPIGGGNIGNNGFKCQAPGIYADADCYYYIICDATLRAQRVKAPNNWHFDRASMQIKKGTC